MARIVFSTLVQKALSEAVDCVQKKASGNNGVGFPALLSPSDTLIVWGNGGLGPTAMHLFRYLPVVMASRFRSSQTSTCHHYCVQGHQKRATVLKCLGCATHQYCKAEVFLAMQATHSSELPDWISVNAIRQSNVWIPLAV